MNFLEYLKWNYKEGSKSKYRRHPEFSSGFEDFTIVILASACFLAIVCTLFLLFIVISIMVLHPILIPLVIIFLVVVIPYSIFRVTKYENVKDIK